MIEISFGVWRSWLARAVWDREVEGSNPFTPTIYIRKFTLKEVRLGLLLINLFISLCIYFPIINHLTFKKLYLNTKNQISLMVFIGFNLSKPMIEDLIDNLGRRP